MKTEAPPGPVPPEVAESAEMNRQGRYEESAALCRRALRGRPECPELLNNLGVALAGMGRLEEAAGEFQRALRLRPEFTAPANNLAAVCIKLRRPEEAWELLTGVLRRDASAVEARNNLATLLRRAGRFTEAGRQLEQALSVRPDLAELWRNLATLRRDEGRLEEAVACYRRAVELRPECPLAASALLMVLNYLPGADPLEVYAEHRAWARRYAEPLGAALRPHGRDPSPERPLRIGYLSPDLRRHPVAFFLQPVLEAHDREGFPVTCYADVAAADSLTERLKALVERWRDVSALSDEQLARQIRADGIDILVDLAGHAGQTRLLVFARKPAPVQVTWLGYPNTTGLRTVDYRISDAWADPPGWSEHLYSEQLVRLPGGFSCWKPPEEAPEVAPPPCLSRGGISFGSFNFVAKVNSRVIEAWAEILRRVPGSRLLLKYSGWDDQGVRRRLEGEFARLGVSAERLVLLGSTYGWREHLSAYGEVDIALDPFPYNGTTTTCDALWMGVPVLVLAGRMHAGRVGVSLLHQIGLPELAADSIPLYVERAVELAGDPGRLARLRAELRERVARSPLTDARSFTRGLEEAYRAMWRRWAGRTGGRMGRT